MRRIMMFLGFLIAVAITPVVMNGQSSTGQQFGVEHNVGSLEAPVEYTNTMNVIGTSPITKRFKENLDEANVSRIVQDINSWGFLQKNIKESIIDGFRNIMPYQNLTIVELDFGNRFYHGGGYLSDDNRYLMIRGFLLYGLSVEYTSQKSGWINKKTTFNTGREEGMMLLEWTGKKWEILMMAPEWCMNFSELSYCLITVNEPMKTSVADNSEALDIQTIDSIVDAKLADIQKESEVAKKADAVGVKDSRKPVQKNLLYIADIDFGLSYASVNSSTVGGNVKSNFMTPRIILDFRIGKDSLTGLILGVGVFNPMNLSGLGSYLTFIGKIGYQFQSFGVYMAGRLPSPASLTWTPSPLDPAFGLEGGISLKLKKVSIGGNLSLLRNRTNSNPARENISSSSTKGNTIGIGVFVTIPINKILN